MGREFCRLRVSEHLGKVLFPYVTWPRSRHKADEHRKLFRQLLSV